MNPSASQPMSRRQAVSRLVLGGVGLATAAGCAKLSPRRGVSRPEMLSAGDEAFLKELERTAALYFVEAAHPETGLVLDRKRADGSPDGRRVASIAATGFGLSVLCMARDRGFVRSDAVRAQVVRTLRWLASYQPTHHGFYYHFIDFGTGARVWDCELSSVDSGLLFCGVIHARACFPSDAEIQTLAARIFERAEWPWLMNGQSTLSMGWRPEAGFLNHYWDHYSELMLIYLLGLGSTDHPLPLETWRAWTRPYREEEGERYVASPAPLFVHQFSHAWFDFKGQRDLDIDWFDNSVIATRAHRRWCLQQRDRFPSWSENLWGVTSSDSSNGYVAWGGAGSEDQLDGTIVPCAAAGSLPFLPKDCLRTLRFQRDRYGGRIWKRYGFVDAWNPQTGWVNPDVIGIDVGISALMAANLRDGFVWRTFGRDRIAKQGMLRAGLLPAVA